MVPASVGNLNVDGLDSRLGLLPVVRELLLAVHEGASGAADALQATCLLLAGLELRGNSAGHGFIGWAADGYAAIRLKAAL